MLVRAHLLNMVARAALRLEAPYDAMRTVERAARTLGAAGRSAAEARRQARALRPFGTCLSRSIAIAAMLPGAHVVIAWCGALQARDGRVPHGAHAHAWVEYRGAPLCADDDVGAEIARLHGSE